MKVFISFILLLVIIGCHDDLMNSNSFLDQIELVTDKSGYSSTDFIHLYLRNKSDFDIVLGYRCDYDNLEMYYQQYETNGWSEDQWFAYMALRCPSVLRTLDEKNSLTHSLAAQEFDSTGTFRLLVPCYVPERDTSVVVISNSFEIN